MGLPSLLVHDEAPPSAASEAPALATVSDGVRLADRQIVLAELGGRRLTRVAATLAQAGASVHIVADIAGTRRSAALLGRDAGVLMDAPAMTMSLSGCITALRSQAAVVLISATATAEERIALLRSGADHVLGTTQPGELVAALAAVLRRAGGPLAPTSDILCCGALSVHLATRTATRAGQVLTLTALEFDLLAYFIRHAGQALTRERLLAGVWGYDIGGLETVTVHLRRLRKKIEADPSRPVLLETVWGVGYRLVHAADTSATTAVQPC